MTAQFRPSGPLAPFSTTILTPIGSVHHTRPPQWDLPQIPELADFSASHRKLGRGGMMMMTGIVWERKHTPPTPGRR